MKPTDLTRMPLPSNHTVLDSGQSYPHIVNRWGWQGPRKKLQEGNEHALHIHVLDIYVTSPTSHTQMWWSPNPADSQGVSFLRWAKCGLLTGDPLGKRKSSGTICNRSVWHALLGTVVGKSGLAQEATSKHQPGCHWPHSWGSPYTEPPIKGTQGESRYWVNCEAKKLVVF